jgi:hypothetical protein
MSSAASPSIPTFNPDEVMMFLANDDWAGCWEYLSKLLANLTPSYNLGFNIALQKGFKDEDRKKYIENFGALAGELFLALLNDPSSKIPHKSFFSLICYHEALHNLFYLFGMDDTDQAVQAILNQKGPLSDADQKRLLLLLSMNTQLDIVSILKRVDTKYRAPAVAAYMFYAKIFDNNIYNNKIKLMELRQEIEKIGDDYQVLSTALVAYFHCSYLDHPNKHLIKENINEGLRRYLTNYQKDFKRIKEDASKGMTIKRDGDKPVMVVITEEFAKGHAMNRGWGAWVKSLQSEFTLVLLVQDSKFDPHFQTQFDNIITYTNIGEFTHRLYALTPDIIVLPSVGMSFYGIVASTMRFAPVQLMGLGHPATTMSNNIDFVYGPGRLYDPVAFPKDIYVMDDAPFRFVPNMPREAILSRPVRSRVAGDNSPLRVSVVGSNIKVSYPFLKMLMEIEAAAPFDIHFNFHMGSVGMETLYMQKNLQRKFKHLTYHGWQTYPDYFESLAQTDIILNPFPFGHTNTIIDTLLLGKPCVGLEGVEPSAKTEAYILDIVGLTDKFSAKNLDDYKQKFFAIADQVMLGDTVFYDRAHVFDSLYGEQQDTDFGKSIKWVYDHHKAIKSSGRKSVRVFDTL